MLQSTLKRAVAMTLAALALLAVAAPAADARKSVAVNEPPADDLILLPVKPVFPIDLITPCICLPPVD